MNPLMQENTVDEKRSFEGERSLIEERSSSEPNRLPSNLDSSTNEEGSLKVKENALQDLNGQGYPKSSSFNSDNMQESPREKDTPAAEDTEMSNDTSNISHGLGSFDSSPRGKSEGMQIRACNETKEKSTTIEPSLPQKMNDSSDEAKDEVSGHSSCTENAALQFDKNEIAKGRSDHDKKTAESKQPTRSSLRTSQRMVLETPSAETSKKEPTKKHFCMYCKIAFTQLVKHLEMDHAEETHVAQAMQFPKGSRDRQTLLDEIRNKGNYEHNCEVQKSGEGEIMMKKEVKNSSLCVRDYLPCKHCFAFHRKTDLWRHERSCKSKKGDQKSSEDTKKNHDGSAASQLLPMSEFLTESCEEIMNVMHQDDIARHIRNDPLICKYGNALSTKYDHDKSQFAYIAQKMRELGRFILAVNELDKTVQYLHEICLPSRFELAVEGAKKLSGFDPSSTKFKTFSLVPKIHYSLKRAAEIAFGESRMTEDSETEGQVKQFIQLLDTKWNGCFSHKALASSAQKHDIKKVEMDISTVTEDLIKLYKYIKNEGDEARKELKENPSLSPWKKLSEATLADVCLFNRRRIGNIGRLLLQTYTSRNNRKVLVPSADQMRKSTKLELDLGDKFTKLELEGQYGRNMLILLTERMMSSIDMLVENRDQAGVSKNNPYLFARAEGPSFVRALDCFRRAAMECGVKNPETLLSPSLRDQIACCWQLMSLGEQELDQVAMQTGRRSEDCNRLCENASQLEEVSKQLLKMDRKIPISPPATVRDGTVPKTPTKRKPWSEKEQAAVKRYLGNFITMMKVPGKKDCNACIAAEPDLLGRSWTDVKSYVHNTVQTIRRKSNQQRCEVTQTTKKDLADMHAVGGMATVRPSELRESPNCCDMTTASPTNLTKSLTSAVAPFPEDMTSGYVPMSSASTSVLHASQPLISSFTPLNATDTQVVPTFTPHNTTNSSLMSPIYTSENIRFPPMSPVYTQQNTTRMSLPPVYTQQDITSSSAIPTFTPLNAPSTQMAPRFTQLNSQSTSVVPGFSPLFAESRPIISSFTPLNHLSPPAYPTSPPGPSTTSQVVPSIHALNVPDRASVVQERTPMPLAGNEVAQSVKPQKRTKRLWSEEEQSAVRRQLGDFCKLVKVPGKKDCDACLAAEPALSTRTWREVKYFVHNSIQSMKRRNALSAPKPHEEKEHETTSFNTEWDGPVYLSL